MKIGKKEKEQVKLVQDWNIMYPVGIDVIVRKDDGTEVTSAGFRTDIKDELRFFRTKTRSAAYMLGASGEPLVKWKEAEP